MIEYTVKVYPSGTKKWFFNDQLHREDGPAIEGANGFKYWYLKGRRVTEEEHKRLTSPVVEMTMEEINKALGKKVKVVGE